MPSKTTPKGPKITNMTDETITENTILVNSQHKDMRLMFLLQKAVEHLHDFARETRLTTDEWMAAIEFFTAVGKMCSDIRQEFILLSDTMGLSVLVDAISHPKPSHVTVGTLLGPFHTHDAEEKHQGDSICSEGKGEPLLIEGTLTDSTGKPLADASIDLWHCDANGLYDTQYEHREDPDMRGIVKTKEDGSFVIKCTRPVPYAIPHDGPVGKLLQKLNRHPYRPAHIHFIIKKEGYDELITALYHKGDPYETSDAVFGVKTPLLFTLSKVGEEKAKKYNMKPDDWYLKWDFSIVTEEESRNLVLENNKKALGKSDDKVVINSDGLPEFAPLD
ncbi:hypothetical protein KGF56_003757 [Candida oxycetoniae]|uniref:Intradiol ring-cleavage dioxygenases domain-containing protein n=1 Tax=Candida oxycetoniae TaxID=497107 RepID=A0AAI9WWX8_9ASCO|nr:uncharacterized protein KGF56_003757 [Candida oxycetoniae]KAI3403473.1 hypothetical protein KGF56_003757 [Candida oxycetoniae]